MLSQLYGRFPIYIGELWICSPQNFEVFAFALPPFLFWLFVLTNNIIKNN